MTTNSPKNRPRTAFVVDLGDAPMQPADIARLHHLIGLFRSHRIPTTWAVGNAERATLLHQEGLASEVDKLALSLGSHPTEPVAKKQFRSQLASQVIDLGIASGLKIEVVTGDSHMLRGHAPLLAEQGVRAIVSMGQPKNAELAPRSLPLGIWQFTPGLWIPQPSRLSRLLFSQIATAKQWIVRMEESATVIAISSTQLGHLSPRKLRQLERFVRDIAWSASRGQLELTTIGQLASELTSAAEVQPQQSILRMAA